MGDTGSGSSSGNGSALARFLCSSELNEMSLSNLLLTEACNMPGAACVCLLHGRQMRDGFGNLSAERERGSERVRETLSGGRR